MPALLIGWGARITAMLTGYAVSDIFNWFSDDDQSITETVSMYLLAFVFMVVLLLIVIIWKWKELKRVFR